MRARPLFKILENDLMAKEVVCPKFSCINGEENRKMTYKTLLVHLSICNTKKNECPNDCGRTLNANDDFEEHYENCPESYM